VVHFAVVLLPLATIGVILTIFVPKLRSHYLALSVLGVFLGTGAAFVAKESGEALSERVGLPARHADLGTKLFITSALFLVLTLLWFQLNKRRSLKRTHLLSMVTSMAGLAVVGLSVITGHTGAEAVWQGKLNPTAAASNTPASESSYEVFSMSDVAEHNSPDDCWSAINGKVYNLTDWIDKHPGGSVIIKSLCGQDGSAGFTAQHGGKSRPEAELARFLVGTLAK
jgi:cytochrome b involved in lipid metabolism